MVPGWSTGPSKARRLKAETVSQRPRPPPYKRAWNLPCSSQSLAPPGLTPIRRLAGPPALRDQTWPKLFRRLHLGQSRVYRRGTLVSMRRRDGKASDRRSRDQEVERLSDESLLGPEAEPMAAERRPEHPLELRDELGQRVFDRRGRRLAYNAEGEAIGTFGGPPWTDADGEYVGPPQDDLEPSAAASATPTDLAASEDEYGAPEAESAEPRRPEASWVVGSEPETTGKLLPMPVTLSGPSEPGSRSWRWKRWW